MRVNIYAEEMPDEPRLEIIEKVIDKHTFTALRIYLELPVSLYGARNETVTKDIGAIDHTAVRQVNGPFIHHPGDDDSAAVTFWGKRDLRVLLRRALEMLDAHYDAPRKRAE